MNYDLLVQFLGMVGICLVTLFIVFLRYLASNVFDLSLFFISLIISGIWLGFHSIIILLERSTNQSTKKEKGRD